MALHQWAQRELGGESVEVLNRKIDSYDELFEIAIKAEILVPCSGRDWSCLETILVEIRPDISETISNWITTSERLNHALEILLWYAVFKSPNKQQHISHIMEMGEAAAEIQTIIQEQQAIINNYSNNQIETTSIQQENHNKSENHQAEIDTFKLQIESLNKEVKHLKDREQEMEMMVDVANKSQKAASKACLDEEIKVIEQKKIIEEQSLMNEKLREQNDKLKEDNHRNDNAIYDLKDKLEISEECERKLSHATMQITKFKEKMEEMSDLKDQLAAEQEARACSVEKILSLENQLSVIPTLKKQLDDYKQKVIDTELELRKLTKDMSRKNGLVDEVESLKKELKDKEDEHQRQIDKFKDELASSDLGRTSECLSMGFAGTELSPELSEKIARLESENKSLKELLNENDVDKIAALMNDLDVEKRISANYESQLEETTNNLNKSIKQNEDLETSIMKLKNDLNELTIAKLKVDDQILQETKTRQQETKTRQQEKQTFKQEMEICQVASLKQQSLCERQSQAMLWLHRNLAKQQVMDLASQLRDVNSKHQNLVEALAKKEAELSMSKESIETLNNAMTELKEVIEKQTKEHNNVLTETETKHQETLQVIKIDLEKQLIETETTLKNQLEETKNKYDIEMSDLKTMHNQVFNEKCQCYENKIEEISQDYHNKVEGLTNDLLNYKNEYSISNEQHQKEYNVLSKKCHLLSFQLKECEETVDELEGKNRKLNREKKFLSDELNEVSASSNGNGSSKTIMLEYAALQKEYKTLSNKFKVSQEQVRSLESGGTMSLNSAMSQVPPPSSQSVIEPSYNTRSTRSSTRTNQMSDLVVVYERRAEKLEEEKREILMKCNIAISDREQAIQEASKLRQALASEKEKSTGLELQKERAYRGLAQLKSAQKLKSASKKGLFASPPNASNMSTTLSADEKENHIDLTHVLNDMESVPSCNQS